MPLRNYNHSYFPYRFTKKLKEILFLKKKTHATFKSTANICDYRIFSLLRERFQKRSQVDVYTDFSKVFNSVNHKVPLQVLGASRFCEPLLPWIN